MTVTDRLVPYNRDVIHKYFEDSYVVDPNGLDSFAKQVARENWDYDQIMTDICHVNDTY